MSDMLIQGGVVIDGTGAPRRQADVRVRNGKIIEVAPGLKADGEQVIDASDALVTPGFIDSHTHYDAAVFWDPACDPMPQHGVTSMLIGNCSLGLAPIKKADRARITDLFSYIEDIPFSAFQAAITWEWETYDDYAQALSKRRYGVNVGALIAHSLLRIYVMGDDAWRRTATREEAQAMAQELRRALAAGALGLSASTLDKDRDGHRVPSYFADDDEFDLLFAELGKAGALFEFVPASQASLNDELARFGRLSAKHKVMVVHNSLLQLPSKPDFAPRALAQLREFNAAGSRIYSLMSPRRFDLEVNFDNTLCFLKLPVWNQLIQAARPAKRALLADPEWCRRAREEFDGCKDSPMFPVYRLGDIWVLSVGKDENREWIGRSLKDLADARGGHPSDVLGQWLLENDFEVRFLNSMGNTDPDLIGEYLKEPSVILSGSDAGAHLQMFCAVGDTTLYLTRYVRDQPLFSWEHGIQQLTGRQAQMLNLHDRGYVAPGQAADLVIFRPEDLHYGSESLVHDLPGDQPRLTRPPGGYRHTIVNGVVVQTEGKSTGALPAHYLNMH